MPRLIISAFGLSLLSIHFILLDRLIFLSDVIRINRSTEIYDPGIHRDDDEDAGRCLSPAYVALVPARPPMCPHTAPCVRPCDPRAVMRPKRRITFAPRFFFNSFRIGFSVFPFPSVNSLGSWEEVLVVSYQPLGRIRKIEVKVTFCLLPPLLSVTYSSNSVDAQTQLRRVPSTPRI